MSGRNGYPRRNRKRLRAIKLAKNLRASSSNLQKGMNLMVNSNSQQQQNECPQGCCNGDEILCVSIPCPIDIVLLGIDLQLELPCLRLTSESNLTPDQVNKLVSTLTSLLGNVTIPTQS